MTEEQEIVTEQIETPVVENTPPPQSDAEKNFANMRLKLREMEQEKEQLKNFIKELTEKQQQPQDNALEDEFATRATSKKDAAEVLEAGFKKFEEKNWKRLIKADHPDYDEVATFENMQKLEEEMPEIAELIKNSPTKLDMASATYKAIKRMNSMNSTKKEIEDNKKQLEKNKDKPMSSAAVDKRPIAQVARYTEKEYEDLWKEMHFYASKA